MISEDTLIQTLQDEMATLQRRTRLYEAIVQHIPTGVAVWHLEQPDDPFSFQLVCANEAANQQSNGIELSAKVGQRLIDIFPTTPEALLHAYVDVIRSGQPRDLGEGTYVDEHIGEQVLSIQLFPLSDNCVSVVFENVTERKRAAEALRQSIALEETVRAQQATLAELSTPLIPLNDQVMVMPLIGSVDSRRAQQVIDTLLQGISTSGAQVAILDITGVPVVDTQVANALIRAAQAVKLLGAQVVLTGIRPEVAQTLVGIGTDLSGVTTRSSLQSGIAYATNPN
jgi:anti-anti-sigma regulatory factor